jgi:hypothetical protein
MSARIKTTRGLFLLLLALFVLGLYQLMALRFESGDVFPPYSTLNSQPLGTKILYEAFNALPDYSSERNYGKFRVISERESTTLFVLGLDPAMLPRWPDDLLSDIETWLRHGNRLVIAFEPVQGRSKPEPKEEATEPAAAESDETVTDESEEETNFLDRQWGLRLDYDAVTGDDGRRFQLAQRTDSREHPGFPTQLEQHSELYFATPDEKWLVLYRLDNRPVLMERRFGAGSLVVVADAFLTSNEAMHFDRHPALLGWLAGANRQLIFDENHHGIARQSGIMVLAHKYRLTFFFVALVTLAGLTIWKWSVPFAPVRRAAVRRGSEELSGMDYLAGLINLLRRSVRPDKLLAVCVREWRKSYLPADAKPTTEEEKIGAIVRQPLPKTARDKQILIRYRKIIDILAERKRIWK